jgi:hypothetical protein
VIYGLMAATLGRRFELSPDTTRFANVLLSIAHICKYRGLSFLEFRLSGDT